MAKIGVVGAGIAGLHLGLFLQKEGVDVTLYTDRTAEHLRTGRLPNTVALFPQTLDKDTALGTNRWEGSELGSSCVRLFAHGSPPLFFQGNLPRPALFLDMRLYLPSLLSDFEERGGRVIHQALSPEAVSDLSSEYDLLVIASGRAGLTSMFARVPERSPYTDPQRLLFAGLFEGIRFPDPLGMSFHIVPGQGEIFENQFLTASGPTSGLLIEALPGSALEAATKLSYDESPQRFDEMMLSMLRSFAPITYERTDPKAFRLRGPLDMLQGAVTPTARKATTKLPNGKLAIAVGDTYITHDPLTGQGANAASRSAWLVAEIVKEYILSDKPLGDALAGEVEAKLWESEQPVTEWSNAFLAPPPPHALALMAHATQHQKVADAFAESFTQPKRQWDILKSPEGVARLLGELGVSPPV